MTERYTELDALRGLAAVSVVLYHFRAMWWGTASNKWLTLISPLTNGEEAVLLFFLLSGFVLAVPYTRGSNQGYLVFLVRRILRIYAPYLFALLFAVIGAYIWHGALHRTEWADHTWSRPVSLSLVLAHVLMLGNYDITEFNTAFWSLVVEMRISIFYPLLYLLTSAVPAVAGLVAAALCCALGGTTMVGFVGIFIAGITLALNIERVNAWFLSLKTVQWTLIAVGSFILYNFGARVHTFKNINLYCAIVTLGALGYMLIAMNVPLAKHVLHMVWARFLGRISYSLYLMHGTVLFALTHILGRTPIVVQFAIYVPTAIVVSYVFCRVIEEPFLRINRLVAKSAWARHRIATEPV